MLFTQRDAASLLNRTLAIIMADGVMTDTEKQYFQELQRTLAIPDEVVAPMLQRHGLTEQERQRRHAEEQHRQTVGRQLALVAVEQERRRPAEEWLRWQQAEEQRRELAAQESSEIEQQERHGVLNEALRRRAEERRQQRYEQLKARFGAWTAPRIMDREIWKGQTREMLVEAFGRPLDIDEQVLKTKTKTIYKYESRGANRYALRVTLEQDVVVSWEDKR